MNFLQQLVNGLSQGSIYALIALGYTLVFGVLRFINFSHGDVMMAGAYSGFFAATVLKLNLWQSLLFAGVFCALLGYLIQKIVYSPFISSAGARKNQRILVAAVGVSFVLEYSVMLLFGSQPRGYPADFTGTVQKLGGVYIDSQKIGVFITAAVVCVFLTLFFKKTKYGVAIRGYASDKTGAEICGVSSQKAVAVCFVIGCTVAGFSGVLYGCVFSLQPLMGIEPGIKAFTAAVIGGIGSIPGAFLGGIFLGLAETFCAAFISSAFKNLVAFVLLIITLVLFPSGFAGKSDASGSIRN